MLGTIAQLRAIVDDDGGLHQHFPLDRLEGVTIAGPADLTDAIHWAFESYGTDAGHELADALLLRYIGNPTVKAAYNGYMRWHS